MINTIDIDDLRALDLNLLPVFAVLLQERSTTKAAAHLGMGQPAVSAALARLREVFNDPLFTRVARGLEPTPRALDLAAKLEPGFTAIRSALRPPAAFDPATVSAVVRLGLPDNHEHFLMPRLLVELQRRAPGIRIVARPTSGATAPRQLDDHEIDLACGRIDHTAAWQRRQELLKVGYLTLFSRSRLGFKGELTLARFLALPHLLMSAGGDLEGVVDEALKRIGKTRRVIYATSRFAAIPGVLQRVRAVATLPEHSATRFAKAYRLETAPPPVPLQPYMTALVWLSRLDEDPLHRWLRQTIIECLREIGAGKNSGAPV